MAGHWKAYFDPSEYLSAADLMDAEGKTKNSTLTIKSVSEGALPIQGTSKNERKPILAFHETDRKMACNKTNCKTLAQLYTPLTQNWIGKRITLFQTTTNGKGGEVVDCIRIRPQIPQGKGAVAAAPAAAGLEFDPTTDKVVQA